MDVNRDGSVIFAWWTGYESGVTFFDAFERDGTVISSGTLTNFSQSRSGELDAAGDRAFVLGLDSAVVWDIATGQPEARMKVYSIFDTLALSIAEGESGQVTWIGIAGALNGRLSGVRLDPATLIGVLGPWVVPPGGLAWTVPLPADPALAGLMLHAQGFRTGADGSQVTSKVSVRVML